MHLIFFLAQFSTEYFDYSHHPFDRIFLARCLNPSQLCYQAKELINILPAFRSTATCGQAAHGEECNHVSNHECFGAQFFKVIQLY